MAIIGTIGACLYLLGRTVYGRVHPPLDEYQGKKEKWFQEHTDPVFGRPVDNAFHWREGRTEDGKVIPRPYEYKAPFRHAKSGYVKVTVDEFPLEQQKEMFLWLEEKIDAIGKLVPSLLLYSSEDDLERGGAFFGVPSPDQAETAFKPEYITDISLHGSNPVRWVVHFDAGNVSQDVYGRIEGKDEAVQYASLYM